MATLFQLILTVIIVPETQNLSRSLIRTSNVDFFESFIKPKKFNDNVNNLTIYADQKNKDGSLKDIYLKKNNNNNEFQITIAKKGVFKTINSTKILVLYNGQTINSLNNNITNISFNKSDFILSKFDTNVIITNKMQETKTIDHIYCLKKYLKKDLTINQKQIKYINHNCSVDNLDRLYQELYKRFIVPLYIPILLSTSLLLIISSKENKSYNKYRIGIFLLGLMFIILSETSLKFITINFYDNIKFIILPILIFLIIYIFFKLKLKENLKL